MQQAKHTLTKFLLLGAVAVFPLVSVPADTALAARSSSPQVKETRQGLPLQTADEQLGNSATARAQAPTGPSKRIRPSADASTTRVVPRGSFRERIDAILHPEEPEPLEVPFVRPDVPKTVSAYDNSIIGTPLATQEQCVRYLLDYNPNPSISVSPERLVALYYEEGEREGIRPDVAFAQALKETGFFRYGGDVVPAQNNYCGLGTTGGGVRGAYFANAQLGVRAHIQHLLAYAATRRPQGVIVDPRYQLVRGVYGNRTLGEWQDLNGRWAVPGDSYGQSILSMFRAILNE